MYGPANHVSGRAFREQISPGLRAQRGVIMDYTAVADNGTQGFTHVKQAASVSHAHSVMWTEWFMRGEKWERHVTVTRGQGGEEGDRWWCCRVGWQICRRRRTCSLVRVHPRVLM